MPVTANSFSSSSLSGVSSFIGMGPLIFRFPFLIASAFQLERCKLLCPLMSAATNPSRVSMWCGCTLLSAVAAAVPDVGQEMAAVVLCRWRLQLRS